MQDYVRGEVLEQLEHAWRDAALGASKQAEQHIGEVLDLLDQTVAKDSELEGSLKTARSYLEEACESVAQSDALGGILALVAALQELQQHKGRL